MKFSLAKNNIENAPEDVIKTVETETVPVEINELVADPVMPQPVRLPQEKLYRQVRRSIPAPAPKRELPQTDARISAKLPMFFRLSIQEQMLFAKRLAILLKSGVPILTALNMLKKQSASKSSKYLVEDLAKGVESGQFLHMRLDKFRKFFGDFAVNIIKVGEVSGTLHENLGYLAEELKKKRELRRKVIGALVYPVFIVVATLGVTVLLTVYVFPKILPILSTFNTQLPLTTRTLIFVSSLFIHWGWLIILVGIALVAAFIFAMRTPAFALLIDRVLLKIPVLGNLLESYNMANICRTLGVLLQSDVRIVEAVKITASTTTNLLYQSSLNKLSGAIVKGGKISSFLEEEGKIYPPMVSQMITVGESTGKLSDSLAYLAEIYENEVDDLTKNLSTSIEPLLMIFMGLMVGFIAVSIITPIYSFTQHITPYNH
jgi:type II secretory pathway component PulF